MERKKYLKNKTSKKKVYKDQDKKIETFERFNL